MVLHCVHFLHLAVVLVQKDPRDRTPILTGASVGQTKNVGHELAH
jgi:hypothetical protein